MFCIYYNIHLRREKPPDRLQQRHNHGKHAYNPKGLRSQKTVGGATKYFVWEGMNVVYEYDASGGTTYYYGLHRVSEGNSQFYLYNAHGDVVQLTDGTGAVTKSYAYDAFGNEINQDASDTNPFRYCGEYYDVETDTIYLRARYYDPTIGGFTQQYAWAFLDRSFLDMLTAESHVFFMCFHFFFIECSITNKVGAGRISNKPFSTEAQRAVRANR